ncbi:MAG: NAD+ synthase [Actinomycetota bacterium]|nr:MAG: NAD+ synthase [Actinomycetota bacterium]
MPSLRLALAQCNPTVGAIAANAADVRRWTAQAAAAGADLVAFPELMLTGYPVEDLALRPSFREASRHALHQLAGDLADDGLAGIPVVVGHLDWIDGREDRVGAPRGAPVNAASVLYGGQAVARYVKHHLPNYGVFDEARYFVPGAQACVVRVRGVDVALAICEDLWQPGGPVAQVRGTHAGLLVVINGSPYERNKDDVRLQLCTDRAAEAGCTLAYLNMVGGQDELVFDGDSIVVSPAGDLLARGPQFAEHLLVVDLDLPAATAPRRLPDGGDILVLPDHPTPDRPRQIPPRAEPLAEPADVYAALVLGLRDYVRKNGFRSVVLGLSGGIDSALVAAIACDAIGAQNVYGVSMPSSYSSEHSRSDAAELARRTGCQLRTVPIAGMVDAFAAVLPLSGLSEENLQARVRGTTLMAISNSEGHLVLATGNKSELSVGYSTIYGDAVGGFAPLKDVAKTLVWELARQRNAAALAAGQVPPIPESSIDKPPSAELRPGQLDSDSLPDYAVLDDLLDDYVEHDRSAADLAAQGFDPILVEDVLRLTDGAEWKRRQYPPGTKISFRAFGRDRRLPITNRWREPAPPSPPHPSPPQQQSAGPGLDEAPAG